MSPCNSLITATKLVLSTLISESKLLSVPIAVVLLPILVVLVVLAVVLLPIAVALADISLSLLQ